MDELIKKVITWIHERRIHEHNSKVMMCKAIEEFGEIANALNKNLGKEELKDAIGDTVITLMGIVEQQGLTLKDCIETSYNNIKDRKGKIIDGIFVKESDLKLKENGNFKQS